MSEIRKVAATDENGSYTDFVLATNIDAKREDVDFLLSQPVDNWDGRSDWRWVRLQNGDLMLAVFPCGETYFYIAERCGI